MAALSSVAASIGRSSGVQFEQYVHESRLLPIGNIAIDLPQRRARRRIRLLFAGRTRRLRP